MSQFVRFTIDGTECMATRGQFLVDAAKENGIYVPTLCNYPGVKPKGFMQDMHRSGERQINDSLHNSRCGRYEY